MTSDVWWAVATWAVALTASVLGGWYLVPAVLRMAARTPEAPPGGPARIEHHAGPAAADPASSNDPGANASQPANGVLRGGTWIGLLERLALTASILVGFAGAAAVVVAVKGLGRYPELRAHPDLSERFVIGTLASLVWAGLWGAAGAAVIGAL